MVDSALGPTALTKAGPGTVILGGNSTYTGQTFLTAGTTSIATDHPLGGGNGTILDRRQRSRQLRPFGHVGQCHVASRIWRGLDTVRQYGNVD